MQFSVALFTYIKAQNKHAVRLTGSTVNAFLSIAQTQCGGNRTVKAYRDFDGLCEQTV